MGDKLFHATSRDDLYVMGVEDGLYEGTWQGYYVKMISGSDEVIFRVDYAVKDTASVSIQVEEGKGYIRTKMLNTEGIESEEIKAEAEAAEKLIKDAQNSHALEEKGNRIIHSSVDKITGK